MEAKQITAEIFRLAELYLEKSEGLENMESYQIRENKLSNGFCSFAQYTESSTYLLDYYSMIPFLLSIIIDRPNYAVFFWPSYGNESNKSAIRIRRIVCIKLLNNREALEPTINELVEKWKKQTL